MNIVEPFERLALAQPEFAAIVADGQTVTYRVLLGSVWRIAAGLRAHGVQPGERVAQAMNAPAANIALTLALARIGAVSVGTMGGAGQPDLGELLQRLGVSWVVHNSEAEAPLAAYDGLKGQLQIQRLLASELPRGLPEAPFAVEHDTPWRIALSSGTTGRPKGIALAHGGNLLATHLTSAALPPAKDERMLVSLHVNTGFATTYWLRCLHAGACVVLPNGNTPEETMQLLHEQAITMGVVSTGMGVGLAKLADKEGSSYTVPPPSLARLVVSGARISQQVREVLQRHVCPVIQNNLGAAETGLTAVDEAWARAKYPGAVGRLLPWVRAYAADEQGEPLPAGQPGPLRFQTPAAALGYVGADPADEGCFRDGWFQSADRGYVTPDGVVVLGGRASDVINIMGVKFDAERLEAHIQQDGSVLECCAVEAPGDMGQPMLALVVVPSGPLDVEALRKRCALLGPAYVPRYVFEAQALPRNEGGKVVRADVRASVQLQVQQMQES